MNRERVEYCIGLMQKAQSLDMRYYLGYIDDLEEYSHIPSSIEELHKCGNTACFAGYLALSKEFKSLGGFNIEGSPYILIDGFYYKGYSAIAYFLDIGINLAYSLVTGDVTGDITRTNEYSEFYGKDFGLVTPEDVIAKLQLILEGKLQ